MLFIFSIPPGLEALQNRGVTPFAVDVGVVHKGRIKIFKPKCRFFDPHFIQRTPNQNIFSQRVNESIGNRR
jgi:hypothetical protein